MGSVEFRRVVDGKEVTVELRTVVELRTFVDGKYVRVDQAEV